MISLPTRPLFMVAGMQLMTVAVGLLLASVLMRSLAAMTWWGPVVAFCCYGLVATFVVLDLGRHAPHQRFGVANSVTLTRAAVTALLWGVIGERVLGSRASASELEWLLVMAAAAALLLDGIDGWIARRSGMASDFGADFDLEVDSLFALALALLVYGTGRIGVWVLTGGLMRYVFVFAGWLWPILAAPLLPRRRRKVICVTQGGVLIASLAPVVPGEVARCLCLAGLALLAYSFTADVVWLTKVKRA